MFGDFEAAIFDVVFAPEDKHKQENVRIIVECKHEGVKSTDRDNGVDQVHSYLAACSNAQYDVWAGSELQVWEVITTPGGKREIVLATDIPRFGSDAPRPLTRFADFGLF